MTQKNFVPMHQAEFDRLVTLLGVDPHRFADAEEAGDIQVEVASLMELYAEEEYSAPSLAQGVMQDIETLLVRLDSLYME